MNIDKLKKVIQEANPEIMELNEGCEVIYGDEISDPSPVLLGMYKMSFDETKVFNPYNKDDSGYLIEILGRPIRLADVLIAIEKANLEYPISIYASGECYRSFGFEHDGKERLFDWNSKDNNLDNQSDECKEFLIKLLVK
ncbi:MAG TPA: hypothetical protein ENH85_02885 [Candidatus Scalindua sp.]|nr:hypothetical protein [Candidatus Scalindua sp.]